VKKGETMVVKMVDVTISIAGGLKEDSLVVLLDNDRDFFSAVLSDRWKDL
jgi:hypothetical protein